MKSEIIEEFKTKLDLLKKEFERKIYQLNQNFALQNNPYKVGDIIEDHHHIIEIKKINAPYHSVLCDLPICKYVGVELTKKLVPKKLQKDTTMYQCNVKRTINRGVKNV